MNDPYANVTEKLWDSEFSVMENEPLISILDWLYFEALAVEGKALLGKRIIDEEGVY